MAAAAKFHAVAELHNPNLVTVFLTEKGYRPEFLCFLNRCVAEFLERYVFAYLFIDKFVYLANLFGRHFLEMREVEANVVGCYERAFLLHVFSEHFAQRSVEQVSCSMVSFASASHVYVHFCGKLCLRVLGQSFSYVYGKIVFPFRVDYLYFFVFAFKRTTVAYLSTHFGIERRYVEYYFIISLLLLLHGAVAQDTAFVFGKVPSHELFFAFVHYNPVAGLYLCSIAGTFFLFLHFPVEPFLVYGQAVLGAD